jgi:hypothetical protein
MPGVGVPLGRVGGVTGHHHWGWCDVRGTRSGVGDLLKAPTSGDDACGQPRTPLLRGVGSRNQPPVAPRRAQAASATRLALPVLRSMFEMCELTVFSLRKSAPAISG